MRHQWFYINKKEDAKPKIIDHLLSVISGEFYATKWYVEKEFICSEHHKKTNVVAPSPTVDL